MYNINSNVLDGPYSLILSISLCLGVFSLGNILQYFFIKKKILRNYKEINYFLSPIIGTYFLITLLYLIIIFEFYSNFFFNIIAYVLIILSIFSLNKIRKLFNLIKKVLIKKKEITLYLILTIYILYFFIAASPITHADAIDYHFSGSLNLLNLGHFQKEILPMNNNLVSLGEIIMAIGLAVKAEQFSNLIQFLSLIALFPFFKKDNRKHLFLIFILICPINLFLISSYKPQLLFCVSSLLIYIFLINYLPKTNSQDLKFFFPLIVITLCINSLAKYSFHLSSLILIFYCFYLMKKKNLFRYSIVVTLFAFSVLYLPFLLFRNQYFQTGLIDLILSPLPINIYGYQSHHDLVGGGKLDLINIFFPKSILVITTTYGPLLLLIFAMINKRINKYKIPVLMILTFTIMVFIYGSNLPRFLYEGFLWLIFLVSIIYNDKRNPFKFFSKLIYLQVLIIIPVILIFIIRIFPGSINDNFKNKVMLDNANGYELAEWTNKVLDKDDILISSHRSISLFKNKTYSDIFTWHVDLYHQEADIYLDFLKSKKINRILFIENNEEKKIYSNCLGKNLFFKEKAGKNIGRNPFRTSVYYKAWIYEFKYENLPTCLIKRE